MGTGTQSVIATTAVTAENYNELAKAFIAAKKTAVLLSLVKIKVENTEHDPKVRPWGAWRAYFKTRKIPTAFMDMRGAMGNFWQVPAEWPHEFDAEAGVQDDHRAADWFERGYRPERLDLASAAQRAVSVAAYKSRIPSDPRCQPTPADHFLPPAKSMPQDELDRLFSSHAADVEAEAQRMADKRARQQHQFTEAAE